ncbi:helix-turn-helix domain-containing protein [Pseudomonas benzenivorans]|uniref:Helix-turn-helix domain-containing protein n=2 Tax=Pseudomonas benzenivorans TaxID=556533 RepID=A0ABY5H7A1_9PSED|nr:helix-turn-helix domain-containing protein [Pseudomonas benzenivorans]
MPYSPELARHPHRLDLDAPLHRKAGPTAHAMSPLDRASEALTPQACPAPRYLTNHEAAAFLRLSPRTLEKQRVIGGGPRFHKFGRRVMYALTDLEAWAGERSFETTFDPEYLDRHPGAQRDEQ